jgi:hypothetical protein
MPRVSKPVKPSKPIIIKSIGRHQPISTNHTATIQPIQPIRTGALCTDAGPEFYMFRGRVPKTRCQYWSYCRGASPIPAKNLLLYVVRAVVVPWEIFEHIVAKAACNTVRIPTILSSLTMRASDWPRRQCRGRAPGAKIDRWPAVLGESTLLLCLGAPLAAQCTVRAN